MAINRLWRYDLYLTICHSAIIVDINQPMPNGSTLNSVAATFPDSRMSEVLSVVHRQGHGHHARLIRCGHRDFTAQLERAGVPVTIQHAFSSSAETCILVIEAPHQTGSVAELLLGLGAIQVERYAGARPVSTLFNFDPALLRYRTRRGTPRTS